MSHPRITNDLLINLPVCFLIKTTEIRVPYNFIKLYLVGKITFIRRYLNSILV